MLDIDYIGVKHRVNVVLTGNDEIVVFAQTGTGGNEVSADDIFLHTLKIVGLAVDSSLVKHLSGLLE